MGNEAFKKSPKFSKCSDIAQSCADFVGLGAIGGSARSPGESDDQAYGLSAIPSKIPYVPWSRWERVGNIW